MTDNNLLSVVIPAFNVESYIQRCLSSVFSQPDIDRYVDVIVVVDGATDSTLDVVHSTVSRAGAHAKIRIQDNGGLSAARNAGLQMVTTDYVTFLDGDDEWAENYVSHVVSVLREMRPDIIEYNASLIDVHNQQQGSLTITCVDSDEIATPQAFERVFRCYAWARVYRTSLVRNRPFPTGRRFEDTATTPWYYWASHLTVAIHENLICYRQRPCSILASPSSSDIEDIAATTKEASQMYASTNAEYWQRVTHRSFQQGCRRTTFLPFHQWAEAFDKLRLAAYNVPPPTGMVRWLQVHAGLFYVFLLYCRRRLRA